MSQSRIEELRRQAQPALVRELMPVIRSRRAARIRRVLRRPVHAAAKPANACAMMGMNGSAPLM